MVDTESLADPCKLLSFTKEPESFKTHCFQIQPAKRWGAKHHLGTEKKDTIPRAKEKKGNEKKVLGNF